MSFLEIQRLQLAGSSSSTRQCSQRRWKLPSVSKCVDLQTTAILITTCANTGIIVSSEIPLATFLTCLRFLRWKMREKRIRSRSKTVLWNLSRHFTRVKIGPTILERVLLKRYLTWLRAFSCLNIPQKRLASTGIDPSTVWVFPAKVVEWDMQTKTC